MLVYVLVLALTVFRPGSADSRQPDDVTPRNDCFVYHDRSAQTKLSDSRHGYPASDIEEELVKRPYLRPVLFDPDSLPRPNPEYRTSYNEIGKRLHKRSYGFYPIYRQVYPYYRRLEPNPTSGQYLDPAPAHPIRPTLVPFAQRKPVFVIDPKPTHPLHPSLVSHAKHKPGLDVDPKPGSPIHPSPVHHEQPKPVVVVEHKSAHLVHPELALVVQPKNVNAVRVTKPVPTSKPICQSRKFALRRFWLNGGDCFVINPDYQKVTYAKCRYRDCSSCIQHSYGVNHKPVNKCVETFETLYVWAFCSKLTKFNRIKRVSINLPKYCSCQTFTC
ncbi:uncharacterized protein [Haliotis asinina]|uniref:uncharacterized protein n=1 Tax=Haliotis asinina TaxID=109174 RepID=UPI003531A342